MTFAQARFLSKVNALHIRRDSWAADKWFMLWRGTWFVFGTGLLKPVRAADYTSADLRATDWTTVPAALTSCPVTPTEPGGGGPPGPGFPGFPPPGPGGPGGFPPGPGGGPTPPGGGGGGPPLPPPESGTSLRVNFDGITDTQVPTEDDPAVYFEGDGLNGTKALTAAGFGSWQKIGFQVGYYKHPHVDERLEIYWDILVTRTGGGLYSVSLTLNTTQSKQIFLSGGFRTVAGTEQPKNSQIANGATSTIADGIMLFGFATVL